MAHLRKSDMRHNGRLLSSKRADLPREPEAFKRAGQTTFDYQLHGGKGTAKFQWYFLDQSRLPVAVQRWDLQPGASEGLHAHDTERP